MITRIGWRPNSKQVAFTLANVKTYGDVFAVDASLGTLTRWTASEVGGFNPEVLPSPEMIEWKSFDGLAISGILYKPPARFTGPRPVMINIHGGPDQPRASAVRRPQQLPAERARHRDHLPERPGLGRLRPQVRADGQWPGPRRGDQGHRRAPGLDRDTIRSSTSRE